MTKPKVVLLLLLTALVGMSDGTLPIQPLIAGLLGIGLLSSSAAVTNHVVIEKLIAKWLEHTTAPYGCLKSALFAFVLSVVGYIV